MCVFEEHMLPKSQEPVTALHMLAAHAPPPPSSSHYPLLLFLCQLRGAFWSSTKELTHFFSERGGCDTTPWQAGTQGGRQGSVPEG